MMSWWEQLFRRRHKRCSSRVCYQSDSSRQQRQCFLIANDSHKMTSASKPHSSGGGSDDVSDAVVAECSVDETAGDVDAHAADTEAAEIVTQCAVAGADTVVTDAVVVNTSLSVCEVVAEQESNAKRSQHTDIIPASSVLSPDPLVSNCISYFLCLAYANVNVSVSIYVVHQQADPINVLDTLVAM